MRKTYQLENLDCANCAAKIENAVKELEGVTFASVSFMTQRLTVETDAELEKLIREIKKIINKIEPDCELID